MSIQSSASSIDSLERASKKLSKKQNKQNLEKINWRIGENKFEKRISNFTFTNFHEHVNQSDFFKKNEIRNKQSRVILKVKRFVNS